MENLESASDEIVELQNECEKLEIENKELENKIEELEQEKDIPVDRVISRRIFKVILEVNKLTSISKSQKITEQKNIIVNMLKRIVE